MTIHKTVTLDRVMQAVQAQRSTLDNPGFCIACGEDADGCEPDARKYPCELCGKRAVYGAEELLMMMG
jgi:hypothetical protein